MKCKSHKQNTSIDIANRKFSNPGEIKIYTILLVEDDDDLRLLYKRILTSFGFKVIATAKNGNEAVKIYKELSDTIDLIIMDYKMPKKNGIQAGKEILDYDNKAEILIISGDSDIKKTVLSNDMEFLDKSFTIKELLKKLNEIVNSNHF